MPPLFNLTPAPSTWTVTELTAYIRDLFEVDFRLQDVRVAGEISNFSRARSGHLYFTIKDDKAQLKTVMWRSQAERLRFEPQDGDAVEVEGQISVYEAGGVYQLYARRMMPAGRGELALAFEALKERLEAEGLFDPAAKQPIPTFPRKIGIVTSADAAALRDILNVLARRCPLVEVLIAPTLVQGSGAPAQIVKALNWLDGRDDIDTLIIARGGGSLEDLWAFNEEAVARAIYNARTPTIVGVGHETDFTIADFVADLRAPTPSAAAELAVPDVTQLSDRLHAATVYLQQLIGNAIDSAGRDVASLGRTLQLLGPARRLAALRQQVDMLSLRQEQAVGRLLVAARGDVALAQARLTAVSPAGTLARGYAIVRGGDGRVVRRTAEVTPDERLHIQVIDGIINARVEEIDAGQEESSR